MKKLTEEATDLKERLNVLAPGDHRKGILARQMWNTQRSAAEVKDLRLTGGTSLHGNEPDSLSEAQGNDANGDGRDMLLEAELGARYLCGIFREALALENTKCFGGLGSFCNG